ncbi:MAG: FkbM family methyltransferase [Thaumarchaeota archaeon]|nr:FkbM family methyltransferase [Nitrososphaerota archaeon]
MPQISPSSSVMKFLLGKKYIRVIGKKIFRTYEALLPDGNYLLIWSDYENSMKSWWNVEEIYVDRIYEKKFSPHPGDIILDVGANIGIFTLKASKQVGALGKVVSFEPAPNNYSVLDHNVKRNHLTNVKTFPYAISDKEEGSRPFRVYSDHLKNSFFEREDGGKMTSCVRVTIATIDSMVASLNLDHVNFIKIDVEGADAEVIRGAKNTLDHFHPAIAMECHNWSPGSLGIDEILKSAGYAIDVKESGPDRRMVYATEARK